MQVLLVRVREMDRTRLLKLVAETTGGSWEETEGGYRLGIGTRGMDALWREETKQREAWLAKELEGRSAFAAAGRLVGAKALAAIRPGERVVWSSTPNRLQRPLPNGGFEVVRLARGEARKTMEEFARKNGTPVRELPERRVTTMLFAVRRSGDGVSVAFAGVGEDGLNTGYASGAFSPPKATPVGGFAERLPAKPIPFPDAIRAAATPRVDDRTLHPETYEPLAGSVGASVDHVARTAGLGLVACLPDAAFATLQPMGMRAAPFLEEGLSAKWVDRLGELGLDGRIEEGTLALRPRFRASAAQDRADRATLRRRIADAEIDGRTNYRYGHPSAFEQSYLLWTSFQTFTNELVFNEPDWSMPSLWLALNAFQRSQALQGGLSLRSVPWVLDRLRRSAERLDRDWSEFVGTREGEPSLIFADPRWANGVLLAEVAPGVSAVLQAPPPSLPIASSNLDALAARIAPSYAADPARQKETRYWPATQTRVRLKVLTADRQVSVEGEFDFATRDPGPATTMPNVFPALRKALNP